MENRINLACKDRTAIRKAQKIKGATCKAIKSMKKYLFPNAETLPIVTRSSPKRQGKVKDDKTMTD